MRKLKLVITGTGACATGAYAQYLTAAGMPCGHERIFGVRGYEWALKRLEQPECKEADSSWLAAPWLDDPILEGAFVVHLVRDPISWMESVMNVTGGKGIYYQYAVRWDTRMEELGRTWNGYANRWVFWNEMIERKAVGHEYLRIDIARNQIEIMSQLAERLPLYVNPNQQIYRRRHINSHHVVTIGKQRETFSRAQIDNDVWTEVERLAERYGYIL